MPDFLIRRWRAAFHSYFHSPQLSFSSPYPHSILSVLCPLLLLRSQSVKFHCVLLQRVDHESLWEESGKNQSSTLPFLARTKASPCSLSPLSGFPPSFSLHSTPLFPLNRLSTNEELVGLGSDDMTKHRPIWRTIDVRIPETDGWSCDGFCELGENTPLL